MSEKVFVNKDAERLVQIAETFIVSQGEAVELRLIAARLEALDEKVRNLESERSRNFDAGYKLAQDRIYGRSNILKNGRELTPEDGKKIAAAVSAGRVKRIVPQERKRTLPKVIDLNNLKIDLSKLRRTGE